MWNLSALAAKAQEAAARIEKKLDESVGLKEAATASAADAAAATTSDDYDDDFFSDDRHQHHLRGATVDTVVRRQEQRDVIGGGNPGDPPTPPYSRDANGLMSCNAFTFSGRAKTAPTEPWRSINVSGVLGWRRSWTLVWDCRCSFNTGFAAAAVWTATGIR